VISGGRLCSRQDLEHKSSRRRDALQVADDVWHGPVVRGSSMGGNVEVAGNDGHGRGRLGPGRYKMLARFYRYGHGSLCRVVVAAEAEGNTTRIGGGQQGRGVVG
jgi:hypothetical protein